MWPRLAPTGLLLNSRRRVGAEKRNSLINKLGRWYGIPKHPYTHRMIPQRLKDVKLG